MTTVAILRFFLLIALAIFPFLQGGCETAGNTYSTISSIWDKPILLPCPKYRILSDASRVIQFRKGPGRDLVDVNIDGQISDIKMECLTSIDKETNFGNMGVKIKVLFIVKRGPANISKKALLPYFVSVTDKSKNILYREEFMTSIQFKGNLSAMDFFGETIELELPLTPKISSDDYIIYLGFLLNRSQLKYNQRINKKNRL